MPRGGPRPNSGGTRPGAGRKSKTTAERQEANLGIALAKADSNAVAGMVTSMIAKAQEGNVKAFLALAPYLFGSPTQRHEVTGSVEVEGHVTLTDDARAERITALLERARARSGGSAAAAKPDLGAAAWATD